jgi:hypothetical protein
MSLAARRIVTAIAAAAAAFSLAVFLGLRLTPPPRTRLDYLVIGSVATFLMLGVVFGLALAWWIQPARLFLRRRKKEEASAGGPGAAG